MKLQWNVKIKKPKVVYLGILFFIYFVLGMLVLFFMDFSPIIKFFLLATLIFTTQFFKKRI
jgi:hypothetical protein